MDILQLLPKNQYDAAINANSPSAANPFATITDIPAATGNGIYDGSGFLSQNTVVDGSGGYTLDFQSIDNFIVSSDVFKIASLSSSYGIFNVSGLTADRTFTFQNASGTVAYLSDIPAPTGDGIYDGSGTVPTLTKATLTDNITFKTFINNSNPAFRIEEAGVGTNSVFEVANNGTTTVNGTYIYLSNNVAGSSTSSLFINQPTANDTASLYVRGRSGGKIFSFRDSANTQYMSITNAGVVYLQGTNGSNITLNTTVTTAALRVRAGSTDVATYRFENDAGAIRHYMHDTGEVTIGNSTKDNNTSLNVENIIGGDPLTVRTGAGASNTRLRVQADGNVGVNMLGGTATQRLEVNGTLWSKNYSQVGQGSTWDGTNMLTIDGGGSTAVQLIEAKNNAGTFFAVASRGRGSFGSNYDATAMLTVTTVSQDTNNVEAGLKVLNDRLASGTTPRYGAYIEATGAGTTQRNIGLYVRAINNTNANYSIIVPSGGGNAGFGTLTPTSLVTVNGDVETLGSFNGLVVLDRTNGNRYRIYTDNGVLNTELVP